MPRSSRLTPKLMDFAAVYCADPHRNASSAYRQTISDKGSSNTIATEAWKLTQRPDIAQIVARYDERVAQNLILSAADVARIWSENVARSTRLRLTRASIPGIGTTQRLVVMGENRIGMLRGSTRA